jgi:uncharacterized protein
MKTKTITISFFIVLFTTTIFSQTNFKFPDSKGYVNDFEVVFLNNQILYLNQLIQKHDEETSNQIAIVSIKSFKPFNTLFDYSLKLAKYWGVGQKDKKMES